MEVNEKKLMKFVKKIINANRNDIVRAQVELSELAKKLRVDNASDELVDLISDIAVYLPYVELKRAFIPLTGKYLKNQIEKGKSLKQQQDKKENAKNLASTPQTIEKPQAEAKPVKDDKSNPEPFHQFDSLSNYRLNTSIHPEYGAKLSARLSDAINSGNADSINSVMNDIKDAERGCYR